MGCGKSKVDLLHLHIENELKMTRIRENSIHLKKLGY